jgi:hypothetical protein
LNLIIYLFIGKVLVFADKKLDFIKIHRGGLNALHGECYGNIAGIDQID